MYVKIDAHMHFGLEHIEQALVTMDQNNIEVSVNARLWEDQPPADIVRETRRLAGDRVATLVRIGTEDFGRIGDRQYMGKCLDEFRRAVDAGAKGLKISKILGMRARTHDGRWVRVDDERLDPFWAAAGEMGVPVLLHTADPIPYWQPLDDQNPMAEKFRQNPETYFGDGLHLGRLDLLAQRETVMARHRGTVFVNAHWGCYPENLDHLAELFEKHPNFYVDTEPSKIKIVPKGKIHTSHRDVLIRYIDRTMFATDLAYWPGKKVDHPWNKDMYEEQFRWFQTAENDGMNLPPDVLEKFYYKVAKKVYKLS